MNVPSAPSYLKVQLQGDMKKQLLDRLEKSWLADKDTYLLMNVLCYLWKKKLPFQAAGVEYCDRGIDWV